MSGPRLTDRYIEKTDRESSREAGRLPPWEEVCSEAGDHLHECGGAT